MRLSLLCTVSHCQGLRPGACSPPQPTAELAAPAASRARPMMWFCPAELAAAANRSGLGAGVHVVPGVCLSQGMEASGERRLSRVLGGCRMGLGCAPSCRSASVCGRKQALAVQRLWVRTESAKLTLSGSRGERPARAGRGCRQIGGAASPGPVRLWGGEGGPGSALTSPPPHRPSQLSFWFFFAFSVEQASDTENTDPRLPPSTSLRDAPECRMQ